MSHVSSRRRLALAVAAAIAALAASAAPAMASATTCPAAPTSNPFANWGDNADYQLAPGGDVEDAAASWSLTGGAGSSEGNETYMVTSAGDHRSMRLPGTASATTARMCVGVEHPTFRFFAKRQGGSAAGTLRVDVVYSDASGREVSLPVGEVSDSDDWTPTQALPTMVEQIGATPGSAVSISFRFRGQGGGVWSLDDLYVDPHRLP
ncbi:MAG: hypothetical protein QOE31_1794 [Solirubrobacteraceae bacterium]|jgi:hypothetical protein|nr:hypothetical protein [Solirubrobacteraceae bacterium]